MMIALYVILGLLFFVALGLLFFRNQEPTIHGYSVITQIALIVFGVSTIPFTIAAVISFGWIIGLLLVPTYALVYIIGAAVL